MAGLAHILPKVGLKQPTLLDYDMQTGMNLKRCNLKSTYVLIPIIIYVANTWSGVILREPPAGYTLSLT